MTDFADFTAVELLRGYRERSVSPREVMRAVLDRVAMAEPYLAAIWALDADGAMADAEASERRWRAGTPIGPLDGVPISIKEMIATRGVARPSGSAGGDMTPMAEDAPPAARVREAGAIIWGKTTNPDYGMLSSGLSSFHALARNPWDIGKTPGGLSAGAGAAAAAGYGPLHLGTDIGGSLRLPAGWCGIYSLKPSFGRVPIDPPYIGRVAGPMTRTVADSALLMAVLSQPDPRDYMSMPAERVAWDELDGDVRGLRIGLLTEAGCGTPASAEVIAAVERAADVLRDAGADIIPVEPFLTPAMLDGLDRFWRVRFREETRHLPTERYELILPYIREWIETADSFDGRSVYTGFDQIIRMMELGNRHFAGLDFLISPVAPETAFDAELPSPNGDPSRPFDHIGFTVAYNMTGQPAASINCGYGATGLPIGLQIVGRRFDDLGVLRLSHAVERLRSEQRRWPMPW